MILFCTQRVAWEYMSALHKPTSEDIATFADELHAFALEVYTSPGIEKACLSLQEEFETNIPLLLFYLWSSPLDASAARSARTLAGLWKDAVIQPLRQVRQELKRDFPAMEAEGREALRTKVKKAELEAEFLLLGSLAALSKGSAESVSETQLRQATEPTPKLKINDPRLAKIRNAAELFWNRQKS